MADTFEVKSAGKRVRGDAADAQDERLDAIRKKKALDEAHVAEEVSARKAAEEEAARAEAERQAAEAAQREAEEAAAREREAAQREAVKKVGSAALAVGSAVIGSAAENAKKGKLKVSSKAVLFVVVAVVAIAFLLFLAWPRISALLTPEPEPQTHTAAQLSESVAPVNTAADISGAILGEAREERELVVWEQDVQVDSDVTQALANLPIFKKTKAVHSYGTGVFAVDMGKINESSISVDADAHEVVISIPHARLRYVTKDLQKTEFEDTQHALLGFGDVKLTQEQQNLLEQSIESAMRDELETQECLDDADEAALLVVYDVYQPLVAKVDSAFTLTVRFAE